MFSMFGFGPRIAQIDPKEAIERARKGEITLLDVREDDELRASGRAKGAVHVPLAEVMEKCAPDCPTRDPKLDVNTPVAVYCASGGRSSRAAAALTQMGYNEVYNLGGLCDWVDAGGPLER